MSATWSTMSQPALFAGKNRTRRMPAPARMFTSEIESAATAAFASIPLIGTGVVTLVSLFVLVLRLSLVLLLGLAVLISLILSGLTGLVGLVGLTEGLAPAMTKGD